MYESSLLFFVMRTKSNFGGKDIFHLMPYSLSQWELRAVTPAGVNGGPLLTRCSPWLAQFVFFCKPRSPAQGWDHLYHPQWLSTSTINQENTRTDWWSTTDGTLSPGISSCVKWIKTQQHSLVRRHIFGVLSSTSRILVWFIYMANAWMTVGTYQAPIVWWESTAIWNCQQNGRILGCALRFHLQGTPWNQSPPCP